MRLRHVKNIENIDFGQNLLKQPTIINTKNYPYVVLEIGIGKGTFLRSRAMASPQSLFVGIEVMLSILNGALKEQMLAPLSNLILINDDANRIMQYLLPESLNEIVLNFSDPWPKRRQHKRRLTYPHLLNIYHQLLVKGGKISFKTDDSNFFNDSLKYFDSRFDLNVISYSIGEFYTEYEIKKQSKQIYHLEAYKK